MYMLLLLLHKCAYLCVRSAHFKMHVISTFFETLTTRIITIINVRELSTMWYYFQGV